MSTLDWGFVYVVGAAVFITCMAILFKLREYQITKITLPKFMASSKRYRILPDSMMNLDDVWLYGITPKQAERIIKVLKASGLKEHLQPDDFHEEVVAIIEEMTGEK